MVLREYNGGGVQMGVCYKKDSIGQTSGLVTGNSNIQTHGFQIFFRNGIHRNIESIRTSAGFSYS